jgi:acyl-CoA thioester hydrolase
MVLADVEIDFRRPVTFEAGSVRVECGVVDIGESSFRMGYRMFGAGDVAATAESVQVAWDGDSALPVPEPWRAAFRAFEPALE